MYTINDIIEEMKDVPVNRLEELYQFVHSLTPNFKQTESGRERILSFAGIFSDLSEKDYLDFLNQIKDIRTKNFDRKIEV